MYVPNSTSNAYQMDMYIEQKVDKKAEIEKKRQQKLKATRRKLALYMAVFFVALFAILFRYVRIYDLHSDVASQTEKLETIRMENEQTRLSIENMTDKTKIQEYAETQLGLQKIVSTQTVYLNPTKENYMQNLVGSNSKLGGIKGLFAGFLEYLK